MMRQFFAAKEQHPDAILFFRMGDFYETFFDDAVEAAQLLELTLTSRNKKDSDPIPMAGVPHHAADGYIRRLLEAGRKVAICEQVEDPKLAKGIVKREVVRVVTPGVVLDAAALRGNRNNYLAALWRAGPEPDGTDGADKAAVGVAWVDASTGEMRGLTAPDVARALDELARIEPSEILVSVSDDALADRARAAAGQAALSRFARPDGPTAEDPLSQAADALLTYVRDTVMQGTVPIRPLERVSPDGHMRLGADAIRNLEVLRTLAEGRRRGSLLGLTDKTRTAMGARLLKQWLLNPLLDPKAISRRHDAVAALVADPMLRSETRDALQAVYDLERLATRVIAEAAGPRDLGALATSLLRIPDIVHDLTYAGSPVLAELAVSLDPVPEAVMAVREAIVDEPPANLKDGGVIREGFDPDLDELLGIARDGKSWFAAYADELRQQTGIGSLKIRFNSVFGYFIEVTKANLHLVPDTWLRKQTLANCERYYTAQLKEREEKVLGADDRRVQLEGALFEQVRARVAGFGERIAATARAVAVIDVLAGFAELAQRRGYVRPEIDEGLRLEIEGGRHPVIEALMPEGEFVPNDVVLDADAEQLVIITGPNMAGKSTVMRQVALLTLLAQAGSFVPADRARIGIVDQVFTRVGASDNLARGQSTFMVEMTEAATILAQATRRSLVILDEIGRGTSTYDGVSIAWAVAEHIHDVIGARTLFATHYHELTELEATRERVVNMTIAVREWQDEIVFLRRLVPGGTNRSYGIQVARLAGLPQGVVARAREILARLEDGAIARDGRPRLAREDEPAPAGGWQLSLFAPANSPAPLVARLEAMPPDDLTPRDALRLVYELHALLAAEKSR